MIQNRLKYLLIYFVHSEIVITFVQKLLQYGKTK